MAAETVRGRFGGTSGRPYVEARLFLPAIGIEGDVSFLVDTGADSTCLSATDATRLGVDMGRLTEVSYCGGIGGEIAVRPTKGLIAFAGARALHLYEITIDVLEDSAGHDIPSLLGRDVLDRLRMVYQPSKALLSLALTDADHVLEY